MRQALSIFLILFFGLGPLAVTLSADDDSRLPACCRRHGAHHCAMSGLTATQMAALMSAAEPGKQNVKAPTTCPYFPGYTVALNSMTLALAPAPISLPALLAQPHSPAAGRTTALISQIRTRANRGPPASSLA
jgi:hypothetical protein